MADTNWLLPTVLLVEDDAGVRELLANVLSEAGYTVVTASDGGAALRAVDTHLASGTLGAVLLDMMLPVCSGLEVLSSVLAREAPVPVIAMSASRERLHAAREAGATALLPKPFDLDEVLDVVGRIVLHSVG